MKEIAYQPHAQWFQVCSLCGERCRRWVAVASEGTNFQAACEDCIGNCRLALRVGKRQSRWVSTAKRRPLSPIAHALGPKLRRVK